MGNYSVSVVTAATTPPVSLTEVKSHLRVDHTDDDVEILRISKAATAWVVARTNRYYVRTILKAQYWGFPAEICLPSGSVKEIVSITYLDGDNTEQTLAADQYDLDASSRKIYPAYNVSWPTTLYRWNAVQVTYGVGEYDPATSPIDVLAEIPEDIKAAILLACGDLYENKERQQDVQLYKNDYASGLIEPYRIYEL